MADCSRAPFGEVDRPAIVCVGIVKDLDRPLRDCLGALLREQADVAVDELVALDKAVAILIELRKGTAELGLLGFRGQMHSHVSERGLLHFRLGLDNATKGVEIRQLLATIELTWNDDRLDTASLASAKLNLLLTWFLIQGCCRASRADSLLFTSFCRSFVIRSLASALILPQISA